jgi:hypothetical protein
MEIKSPRAKTFANHNPDNNEQKNFWDAHEELYKTCLTEIMAENFIEAESQIKANLPVKTPNFELLGLTTPNLYISYRNKRGFSFYLFLCMAPEELGVNIIAYVDNFAENYYKRYAFYTPPGSSSAHNKNFPNQMIGKDLDARKKHRVRNDLEKRLRISLRRILYGRELIKEMHRKDPLQSTPDSLWGLIVSDLLIALDIVGKYLFVWITPEEIREDDIDHAMESVTEAKVTAALSHILENGFEETAHPAMPLHSPYRRIHQYMAKYENQFKLLLQQYKTLQIVMGSPKEQKAHAEQHYEQHLLKQLESSIDFLIDRKLRQDIQP